MITGRGKCLAAAVFGGLLLAGALPGPASGASAGEAGTVTVYTAQQLAEALAGPGAGVVLAADVELAQALTVAGHKTLCDDGTARTVCAAAGYAGTLLQIPAGAALTVRENAGLSLQGGGQSICLLKVEKAGLATVEGGSFGGCRGEGTAPVEVLGTLCWAGGTLAGCQSSQAPGGVLVDGGTLNVTGGLFENNSTDASGGALLGENGCTITVSGGVFRANTARMFGGAAVVSGTLKVTDGLFEQNAAVGPGGSGGALALLYGEGCVLSGGSFADNSAALYGGAVYVDTWAELTLRGGAVYGNTASGLGGGVFCCPTGGVQPAKPEQDAWVLGENSAGEAGADFYSDAKTLAGRGVTLKPSPGCTLYPDASGSRWQPEGSAVPAGPADYTNASGELALRAVWADGLPVVRGPQLYGNTAADGGALADNGLLYAGGQAPAGASSGGEESGAASGSGAGSESAAPPESAVSSGAGSLPESGSFPGVGSSGAASFPGAGSASGSAAGSSPGASGNSLSLSPAPETPAGSGASGTSPSSPQSAPPTAGQPGTGTPSPAGPLAVLGFAGCGLAAALVRRRPVRGGRPQTRRRTASPKSGN